MKKILLLGAAFIVTMHASFADCVCDRPTFTEQDETAAIYNFVASKLNSSDVRNISLTATIPYATYTPSMDRSLPPIFVRVGPMGHRDGYMGGPIMIERTGPTRCEVECANIENSIRKFKVEFVKETKLCAVDLKVTMTSRNVGFKSVVKQKYAPVCE